MAENWFKVRKYIWATDSNFIEAVSVERVTEKSLVIGKWRVLKKGHENYFPTFDEAKKFALDRADQTIESLKKNLIREESDRIKIIAQEFVV